MNFKEFLKYLDEQENLVNTDKQKSSETELELEDAGEVCQGTSSSDIATVDNVINTIDLVKRKDHKPQL